VAPRRAGIEVEQERQAETWQRHEDDVGRKDHSLHQCEAAHQAATMANKNARMML